MDKKIIELAKTALTYFEAMEKKVSGSAGPESRTIYVTRPETPSWVLDMCRRAHGGALPNDYIYEYVVDALSMEVKRAFREARILPERVKENIKIAESSGEEEPIALYVLTAQSNRLGFFKFS